MVIILILVVLWGVVLAPGVLRRVRSQASHQSIDSFHHSLHLLETSGPKFVEPAYRLVGAHGSDSEAPSLRPRLVLLRPIGQEEEAEMHDHDADYYVDDAEDNRYERYYYEGADEGFGASLPAEAYGRRMAARRRRDILFGLVGTVVVTAILSMVISALIWLTLLSALALVAYVGLMSYAAINGDIGAGRLSTDRGRFVARGVAESYGDDDRWDEDDRFDEGYAAVDGDGWWDQPRRAVGR